MLHAQPRSESPAAPPDDVEEWQAPGAVASHADSPVLFYDARCSVCRRFISFAVGADRKGGLRIAPLQGARGDALRQAYPAFAGRESAVWVAPGQRPLGHSDAILATLAYLGGGWGVLARIGRVVPRALRDRLYRSFADHRNYFARIGLDSLDQRSTQRLIDQEQMPSDVTPSIEPSALASYLNDHLSGSVAAIRLIERIAEAHEETALGRLMSEFRTVIREEQELLRSLVVSGHGTESSLSQAASWLGEKVSRLKIGPGKNDPSGLELFEALEAISLGFWGRRALWRALAQVSVRTPLRVGLDFDALALRAEQQIDALERFRLEAAVVALSPGAVTGTTRR